MSMDIADPAENSWRAIAGHHAHRLMLFPLMSGPLWITANWIFDLSTTAYVIMLGVTIGSGILIGKWGREHQDRICSRCANELSSDGEAEAMARLNSLRFVHLLYAHPVALAVGFAAWCAVAIAMAVVDDAHSIGDMLWCLITGAAVVAFVHTRRVHRRLQQWCPWCGDDDDDDGDCDDDCPVHGPHASKHA